MEKFVLFIPDGGFNDILCGIWNKIEYCRKYNRTLLILMKHSCYHINLSDYFELEEMDVRVVYDTYQIKEIVKNKSIFNHLDIDLVQLVDCEQRHHVGVHYQNGRYSIYRDISLKCPDERVEEDIILENSCGGGHGIHFFKKLILKEQLKKICRERLSMLKDYLCIQVRCTDYKCDYENLYESNKTLIHSYSDIYVATDQKEVFQYFKSKGLNVFCFTTFPEGSYYNLHLSTIDPHTRFCDVIVDMFMATNSRQILSNSRGWFIQLLRDCFKDKSCILEKLI